MPHSKKLSDIERKKRQREATAKSRVLKKINISQSLKNSNLTTKQKEIINQFSKIQDVKSALTITTFITLDYLLEQYQKAYGFETRDEAHNHFGNIFFNWYHQK
jgi:hypothetical protein